MQGRRNRGYRGLALAVLLALGTATAAPSLEFDPGCVRSLWTEGDAAPLAATARPICSQGATNFCGFYAMKVFLELWGESTERRLRSAAPERFPLIDPSFLALAYNLEAGSGNNGTFEHWLTYTTHLWGAVPVGWGVASAELRPTSDAWRAGWHQRHHAQLEDAAVLEPLLRLPYANPGGLWQRSGRKFLRDDAGLDLRRFQWLRNAKQETFPSQNVSGTPTIFRHGTYADTDARLKERATRMGLSLEHENTHPRFLYSSLAAQLHALRPVLASINTNLTKESFYGYRLVTEDDLVAPGKAGFHSVVFVAHCNELTREDPLCAPFRDAMRKRGVSECFLLQNSWSTGAHEQGLVCLTPAALSRILLTLLVDRRYLTE